MPQDVIEAASTAATGCRSAARRPAALRASAALERHLLDDVGLADLVAPPAALRWLEIERARGWAQAHVSVA